MNLTPNSPNPPEQTGDKSTEVAKTNPPLETAKLSTLATSERIPSNWTILPTEEEGVITATCLTTGRTFEGSQHEFSDLLKA